MTTGQPAPGERVSHSVNIRYMERLDQLRGVAVLMVFFAHSLHNFTRGIDGSGAPWLFPRNVLGAILAEGHSGVALFMVLSGFLFGYGAFGRDVETWKFLRNRVLRIYPMYVLVLLLGAYTYKENFDFVRFLASLFLFSNTRSALDGGAYTVLLWTIAAEFVFYLVFPHLNRLRNERGDRFLLQLFGLAIALRVLCVALGASARDFSYFSIFGRIDQFLAGMLAAAWMYQGRVAAWKGAGAIAASVVVVPVSLFAFNRLGGWVSEAPWKVFWPTWEALIYAALIVAFVQSGRSGWSRSPGRLLTFLGTVSYSMYLLHMPVMAAAQRAAPRFLPVFGGQADALSLGLVLLVPVVLLSWFTYRLVEHPFMAMRSGYYRDPRPAAP